MAEISDLLIQAGSLAGAAAAFAAALAYLRNRRKDSMDAYSDLVGKLEVRCATLEKRCDDLEKQIRQEREECAAELKKRDRRIDGLERQLAQVGASGAYLIEKLKSDDE